MFGNLLVCSRGRFISNDGSYYFQKNDGQYLNEISNMFNQTIIIAQEVDSKEKTNEEFLLSNKIICFNFKKVLSNLKLLNNLLSQADVIYLFYPMKISLIFAFLAMILNKHVIAYNGGDWKELESLKYGKGLKKILTQQLYLLFEHFSVLMSDIYLANNNDIIIRNKHKCKVLKAIPFISFLPSDIYHKDVNFTGSTINILSVNHVKPGKNVILLLKAVKKLNSDNSTGIKYKVNIVGKAKSNDPYVIGILEYIKKNALSEYVTLVGVINDKQSLLQFYRQSHILTLATETEGFPRVIWEAFSQGLPVVCSKIDNISSEFDHNNCPILFFDPKNNDDLANAIFEVSTNQETRSKLTNAGYAAYKNKFSISPSEQFFNIVSNLIKGQ